MINDCHIAIGFEVRRKERPNTFPGRRLHGNYRNATSRVARRVGVDRIEPLHTGHRRLRSAWPALRRAASRAVRHLGRVAAQRPEQACRNLVRIGGDIAELFAFGRCDDVVVEIANLVLLTHQWRDQVRVAAGQRRLNGLLDFTEGTLGRPCRNA